MVRFPLAGQAGRRRTRSRRSRRAGGVKGVTEDLTVVDLGRGHKPQAEAAGWVAEVEETEEDETVAGGSEEGIASSSSAGAGVAGK